jgi:hypothetical protein
MPHSYGTCVLLEFDSISHLTEYFKFTYRFGAIFELRGVKIVNVMCNKQLEHLNETVTVTDFSMINDDTDFNNLSLTPGDETSNENYYLCTQECLVYIYSICFSIIMSCSYWTYQTQSDIIEHAVEMYDDDKNQQLSKHFPASIEICGSKIDIVNTSRHEGTLCFASLCSRVPLETAILSNAKQNTGFFIWLSNYCLACVIVNQRKQIKYFILSSSETRELNLLKPFSDPCPLVSRFCDILQLTDPDIEEAEYTIQFLSCQSTLTKSEKQKVQRKHKYTKEKELLCENKRKRYKSVDPIQKGDLSNKNALKYSEMDPVKKEELCKRKSIKHKEMDPLVKRKLNENKSAKYHVMTPSKKKELLEKKVMKHNAIDPSERKAILEKRSISYNKMSASEKEACLERNRTNMKRKYDTINSPQKEKKQEAYQKTKSTEHNLDYFICKFRNKIKEGPYYICSVCNRLLYKKSVRLLDRNSCSSSVPMSVFTNITSFDKKEYICSTCHSKVVKGKIPCQAVYNNMSVDEIPVELAFLEKL